jgi:O-antigen/teichoic acid export membrane protein
MYIECSILQKLRERRRFLRPSHKDIESKIGNVFIIPPRLSLPSRQNLPNQNALLEPPTEELISCLDTEIMLAVNWDKSPRQQDVFFNAMVEDIALQATLKLPIIKIVPAEKSETDQYQVIGSTAGGAAIAGIGDLIFAILRYTTNVVMTNIVSESIYGTYMTAYTSAMLVGSMAALGLDSTMVRFLSTYRAKGEHGHAAGLIRFVMWMTLISGLLCGTLFFLSSTFLAHVIFLNDKYALSLKEVALLVPLIAMQLIIASGLQALKAIKWKVYVDRLIQPMLSLVLIGVFYLLGLRLEALILATICGFLASVITGHVLLRKASRQIVCSTAPSMEPKTWLRFAIPMSLYALIQNMLNSTDVLFLTIFSTAAQVGLYGAADRTSTFVVMPLFALNTIFSPLIAEYYARGEYEQLASLAKIVTKWSFSLSLPVFLCFCVFHEAILSIFSRGYTAAGAVLIILSFGNLVNAGAGSTGSLLVMTGHARVILANTAVTIILNIGLAFFLIPRFNVIGAALAAAMALIILDIAYFIEAYCILKILTFRWDMLKSVAAGGVASMVGLLLLHFTHAGYGYRAIVGTLGLIIPFMFVYLLTLALLRFSKEDMMVFDAVLARIGTKRRA